MRTQIPRTQFLFPRKMFKVKVKKKKRNTNLKRLVVNSCIKSPDSKRNIPLKSWKSWIISKFENLIGSSIFPIMTKICWKIALVEFSMIWFRGSVEEYVCWAISSKLIKLFWIWGEFETLEGEFSFSKSINSPRTRKFDFGNVREFNGICSSISISSSLSLSPSSSSSSSSLPSSSPSSSSFSICSSYLASSFFIGRSKLKPWIQV